MNGASRMLGRLMPTLLMSVGVTFLTAGLLSYAPSTLGEARTPGVVPPAATPPGASMPPASAPPAAPPTPAARSPLQGAPANATRIRIAALEIDLPIVPGDLAVRDSEEEYPLCDVAMYLPDFVQPGQPGATYIYAHAQRGMFLPLLRASQQNDGAALIGALVEVYTADAMLHLYEIDRVKRHATDLSLADTPPGVHQLILQTSEGPAGTIPKLQVGARALSVVPAQPGESLPSPEPRVCPPD